MIGNIYTLQQHLNDGDADTSSFQFFINNIQTGLQKVMTIESNASSSGGGSIGGGSSGAASISNADISNVQSLFTKIQNIFNSGSLQGASGVLQQIISILNGFKAKVSDSKANSLLSSIISDLTQLESQASSGSADMSSFAQLLMSSVNSLNQFIQVLNSLQVSGSGSVSGGGAGGNWSWSFKSA